MFNWSNFSVWGARNAKPRLSISAEAGFCGLGIVDEGDFSVLCRPGGDLLFRVLRRSTIGAGAIYGRVRDGIGYGHPARATRPAKDRGSEHIGFCLARMPEASALLLGANA